MLRKKIKTTKRKIIDRHKEEHHQTYLQIETITSYLAKRGHKHTVKLTTEYKYMSMSTQVDLAPSFNVISPLPKRFYGVALCNIR